MNLDAWYAGLPRLTKLWFTLTVLTTFLVQFGLLQLSDLALWWPPILNKLQLWRLVTNWFYFGPFSMPWIFYPMIICQQFRSLEEAYSGMRGNSKLVFIILYCAGVLTILSTWLELGFIAPSLAFALVQVWSREMPYAPVSLWGFVVPAWQLPFALIALLFISNKGKFPHLLLLGLFVGHSWHFLDSIVPRIYGRYPVAVPEWWHTFFEKYYPPLNVIGYARAAAQPGGGGAAAGGGERPAAAWMQGRGHRLDE